MIRRLIKLICFFMCKWYIRNDTRAYQNDVPFCEYGTLRNDTPAYQIDLLFKCKWYIRNDTLAYQIDFSFL